MDKIIGIAVTIACAIVVYLLHTVLKAEMLAIALLVFSIAIAVVDHKRRYFYLAGLIAYPIFTAVNVAVAKNQSLYPIVAFYELAIVAMVIFGIYLGTQARRWLKTRGIEE